MNKIERMIEKKEQLKLQIEQELKLEQEKFGRWFFNQYKLNSSADAKKLVKEFEEYKQILNDPNVNNEHTI